jgi:hypothetical protein
LLDARRQDRLVAEGGACIAYTHFGFGFFKNGLLNPEFRDVISRLARLGGWFVPASTLLDYLRRQPFWKEELTARARSAMQYRWLCSKLIHGTS